MRRIRSTGALLIAVSMLGACAEQVIEPAEQFVAEPEYARKQAPAADPIPLELQFGESDLIAELERDLASRLINPGDYVCTSTPLIDRLNQQVAQLIAEEPEIIFPLAARGALSIPGDYALIFETEATPQHFGYDGEYTHVLQKTDRDAKEFFDIDASAIHLVAMHGTMLLDEAKVAQTLLLYGLPADTATKWAGEIADLLAASTLLNGGNHPLFTFNAFAFRGSAGLGVPPKIVMGDGILAAYEEMGFADVAPQAVFTHEFAHHIQFQKGYFSDPIRLSMETAAERTRYTELMADAYSAYFMTHSRGLALNRHRVAQFLSVFFNIGDCSFFASGHHGTPLQRMRAAQFGFDVADQAREQGHILTSDQFHALFLAEWEELIAPDAV